MKAGFSKGNPNLNAEGFSLFSVDVSLQLFILPIRIKFTPEFELKTRTGGYHWIREGVRLHCLNRLDVQN